ncbi:MAG TPA: hypothetical protein DDW18_01125, partial [Firmicutes bacterium]|nr:hypothetical protein [Bacillota bacterium]
MSLEERIKDMFVFDWDHLNAPLFSSLLIILVLMVLGILVGMKARKAIKKGAYRHAPKGILFWADAYYDYVSNFTVN